MNKIYKEKQTIDKITILISKNGKEREKEDRIRQPDDLDVLINSYWKKIWQ